MDPQRMLFTRQQIGDLVGLDDATLNYWMREGVLRAAEGGGGKGQHRRFKYTEIHLSALLNEMRQFGAGLPSLKALAGVFRASEDWAIARDIPLLDLRLIYLLHDIGDYFNRNGYYPAPIEDFPGETADDISRITGAERVRLRTWSAIADWLKVSPYYQTELSARFTRKHFEHFENTASAEVSKHWTTLMHLVRLPDTEGKVRKSDPFDLTYFTRSPDGGWIISSSIEAARIGTSHIAINIPRLFYRVWNGDDPIAPEEDEPERSYSLEEVVKYDKADK